MIICQTQESYVAGSLCTHHVVYSVHAIHVFVIWHSILECEYCWKPIFYERIMSSNKQFFSAEICLIRLGIFMSHFLFPLNNLVYVLLSDLLGRVIGDNNYWLLHLSRICKLMIASLTAMNHNYDDNQWTQKKRNKQNGSQSTNHNPWIWPFELVEVNFCFLRRPLVNMFDSSEKCSCWLSRVPTFFMLLKGSVVKNKLSILP